MQKFARKCKSFFKIFNYQLVRKLYKCGLGTTNDEPNVIYGGDLPNPIPQQSFGSLLFNRLMRENRRNDVLQISAKTRVEMTTKECLVKSVALAKRFQQEGVQKGDYILLIGTNSLNMNISLIGTFFMGAVPLPLNNKTSLDEFLKIVNFLKPKYFGCDAKSLFYFKKVLTDSNVFDVSKIFVLNPWKFSVKSEAPVTFEDFIKGWEGNFESFQPVEVNDVKDDLALLLKVSSEGLDAKIIGLTHNNINNIIGRFDSLESHRNLSQEVNLMVQKVGWMSGLYSLFLSCCNGSKLIVLEKFEEENFLKTIQEFQVTTTFLYYAKCWQLLKFTSKNNFDLSSCKHFHSIDGFIPNIFMRKLKEKYGIKPKNCYGFSEFSGSILESDGDVMNGSTGKLVPESYGKIVSDVTYKNAGPNERGEFCVKGPTLCKSYVNDEKGFRNLLDSKGFFLTGYYGYYNEDGEFFIIDRITHQIQYKNYKISPRELEAIIKSIDSVKDVCVAGLPHETEGAYPLAFVSVQKGQSITEQEIINYVNDKVPEFKRIRGVVFIRKVPRNKESGGINRKIVKKALSRFRVKTNSKNLELINEKAQLGEQKKVDRV